MSLRGGLFAVLFIAVVFSQSCGFSFLQRPLDPEILGRVYLRQQAEAAKFVRYLERALARRDVVLAQVAEQADTRISLHEVGYRRELLSTGVDARAREFELVLTVSYSARATAEQGWRLPRRTTTVRRDFLYDEREVLGKSWEEQRLYAEMARELARRIIERLAWATDNPPARH